MFILTIVYEGEYGTLTDIIVSSDSVEKLKKYYEDNLDKKMPLQISVGDSSIDTFSGSYKYYEIETIEVI